MAEKEDEARDAERRTSEALNEASAARETAAKWRNAAARSLADHLADVLADVLTGVPVQGASLTAEYVARYAAWGEADEAYTRAFGRWLRAYEQRKRLEDIEEGGGSGA